MNMVKVFERPVIKVPKLMRRVEKNMQSRGLKTCERRPINGAREDIAIRYEDVSHVALE